MYLKEKSINELLCAVYMLFQSITLIFNINSNINYIIISVLFVILFTINRKNLKISKNIIFITIITSLIFLYTYFFHYNLMISYYLKSFILNGLFTMIFFNFVKDYKQFMKYISYICIIIFLFSFMDPFYNYQKYSDYMSYGFSCIMPCFTIFHIQRKYNGKKIFFPFEILSLCLLIYSNRNSIVTCIILVMILDVFIKKNTLKKILSYIIIIIIGSLFIFNIKPIFNTLQSNFGSDSYAIRSIYYWLNGKSNGLAGRDKLWENSIIEIKENPILGIGIGTFNDKYGNYCHNLFLEFIVSIGGLGLIFIILIICKVINVYKYYKKDIFFYYVMIIGIVPLLFNNTFFRWKYFWIFVFLIFNNNITKINKGEL